jgi:hypothetical protein
MFFRTQISAIDLVGQHRNDNLPGPRCVPKADRKREDTPEAGSTADQHNALVQTLKSDTDRCSLNSLPIDTREAGNKRQPTV